MPVYGDEKRRTMARSVLPAKRSAARQARERRAGTHRAVRAAERRTLRHLVLTIDGERTGDPVAVDDLATAYDDTDAVAPGSRHGGPFDGIADMVARRRGGDAVGPLLRWAVHHATALGDDPAARVAAIATLLPDNLAGHHALAHVRWLPEYDDRPPRWRWPRDSRTHRERSAAALRERRAAIDDLSRRLTAAIHGHGLLNAALKRQRCAACSERGPRLLHGLHDVDAFATHVVDWGSWCERRLVGQVLWYVTRA